VIAAVDANEQGITLNKILAGFETEATSVCLGVAPDQDGMLNRLASEFRPGGMGTWQVHAVDATGRRVGAVVGADRTFVVARGLERRK
jgi:hypothetical protein